MQKGWERSQPWLAPTQRLHQLSPRCRWGKATPGPLQTSCFHAKPQCNPHVCRGQTLSGESAPAAPQHPPLQVLQGDSDPQAVSQEEEGSQDVSPLHHLAQRAPLQHPRTENIPRLLCQEADMDQDLEREGEGSVLGEERGAGGKDKLGFPAQNDLWSPIPSSSFCRL